MSIIAEDQVTITLVDDGKSAYETAIESGYSGTEGEFSSDLARTSEIAEKANSFEVFGTTVYTYISGSTTYDVYKEGEDEEGETARYYYLNANDEKVYVAESQLEHDENDELISRVEGSMLEGVNEDIESLTSGLSLSNETIESIKTATDTNIDHLNNSIGQISSTQSIIRANVSEMQTNVAKHIVMLDRLEGRVVINDEASDPSINIHAIKNDTVNDLEIKSDRVTFKQSGNEVAYLAGNTFASPNMQTTALYMRSIDDNGKLIGTLGWQARSNGHLSLKPIAGGVI